VSSVSSSSDTIFALASGVGRAAIAVIRLSGPQTRFVIETVARRVPKPRHATLTAFADGEDVIDHGLLLWFPGPTSFTGEDSAEFHLHGGRAVISRMLAMLSGLPGCRMAEPGEFARRALVHGKMDLVEAEALADLIDSETEQQRRQAMLLMEGALSDRVAGWRQSLLRAMALVEAELDFADEGDVATDVTAPVLPVLQDLRREIAAVLAGAKAGQHMRDGFVVVIAGPPNAGKSSLLNALARRDVAIVSPIAGTTRDTIEVRLDLDGYPVTLIDTAGLRETDDPIEREGVARALRSVARAELGLWLVPPEGLEAEPPPGPEWIRVRTKVDLVAAAPGDLGISTVTEAGLPDVLALLKEQCSGRTAGSPLVARARQEAALRTALTAVGRAIEGCEAGQALELVADDIRSTARALDHLVGRIHVEQVLDTLFSSFCIGK
jgi:tRNA modification GTPase